ncbi:TetR/AcrR family transcriptional regulator [Croceiramulus getboli]|nr:TetR/AcrR family transcriptional regulator [Flavobacteriaceae bacterium YJPT1-3]
MRTATFQREDALEGALQLFWKKGYHATSMQDLVEATGLNRSSLYNTFGSKIQLYQEALSTYQKRSGDVFQRAVARATNPKEALLFVFEGFMPEIMEDRDGKGCFSMNCKAEMANAHEAVRRFLETHQESALQFFENLVQEGQDQGVFNNDQSAKTYAYFLFSSFQGLRMMGILTKDRAALQGIIASTVASLT